MSELVAFLTGSVLPMPGGSVAVGKIVEVSGALREQLPELAAATEPPQFANEKAMWKWVAEMVEAHGSTVEVRPVS